MLTGLLFGQDVLILKSGESFEGAFYGKVGEDIVFKIEGETSTKKYSINDVNTIVTKNGELTYPFSVTNFDILILKNGTTYFGEYSKIEEEIVYFKPQNAFAFQPISIKQIQTLKLKDGHFIIGGELSNKEIVLTCCVITVVFFLLILIGGGITTTSSGGGGGGYLIGDTVPIQ